MDGWDEAFLWQRWRYFANDDDDDKEKESHTAVENNVDVDASSSDFNDISDCLMSSADASRLFVASTRSLLGPSKTIRIDPCLFGTLSGVN